MKGFIDVELVLRAGLEWRPRLGYEANPWV
jgi:hypothetical protein